MQTNHFFANNHLKTMLGRTRQFCLVALVVFAAAAASGATRAQATAELGPIAYIYPNPDTGDEIRLIELDASNDRLLWKSYVPGAPELIQISSLAWRPDASELAFSSTHEEDCSLFQADIYAVRSDGQGYRRVSGPPACGNPNHLPTGTVQVPVINWTYTYGPFTIYFEGAPGPIEMALAPGQSAMLTFYNVADYGNQQQYAVAIYGEVRSFFGGAGVDVKPNTTLKAGTLEILSGFEHYGFQWPTYSPDGAQLSYIFNKGEVYWVDSDNEEPGLLGTPLSLSMPLSSDFLTWGPTESRANQFLYEGWQDSDTIFLGNQDTGTSQLIMTIDPQRIGKTLLGLTWLPDGSGFLYSVTEMVNYVDKANIFAYSFATGKSTRLTDVASGFIRRMTLSPDGQYLVFEYQGSGYWYEENPSMSLYIMELYGSEAFPLVENGRAPAWSPAALPEPVVADHFLFLPFTRKP